MLNLDFTGYIYGKWILLCFHIGRYSKENLAAWYTLTSTQLGLSKWVKVVLHWTVRKAALELTAPTLLLATHLYSPLSTLFTLVMLSCLLPADKLILALSVVFIGDPFLVHENFGVGLPLALHDNATFNPSSTVRFCGCSENSDGSVVKNKVLDCHVMYVLEACSVWRKNLNGCHLHRKTK